MISRFDETRQGLDHVVRAAFAAAAAKGLLPDAEPAAYVVEIPADPKNGDFSTNAAMVNARAMRCAPQKIAAVLLECFDFGELPVERCEIAGPGFLNFYMKQEWFGSLAAEALEKGAHYGRSDYGQNEKVMVEFVSANPTGPMHMGNARGGAIGDCLAAALEWSGHDVTREFYVNDAGNQINKFGASLSVRYMQLFEGEDKHPLPEDCYQGMDILDHAREFAKLYGDQYVKADEEERRRALVDYALPLNIAALERDLGRYRIHYDVWFRESVLHREGKVTAICEKLKENGYDEPISAGFSAPWAVSHYLGTICQRVVDPEVLAKDYTGGGDFSDPAYIEALNIFKKLGEYMTSDPCSVDHEFARNAFIMGVSPMCYMQLAEMKYMRDDEELNYAFFNFPAVEDGKGDPGQLTGAPEGMMISATAKPEVQEAAIKFMEFVISKESGHRLIAECGEISCVKGAWDETNCDEKQLEAIDLILAATEPAVWQDCATEATIANAFMAGGQLLLTGDMTAEDVMASVQTAAAALK